MQEPFGAAFDNFPEQTASFTLSDIHNGKVIPCNSTAGFTVTANAGNLDPKNFSCVLVVIGAGTIAVAGPVVVSDGSKLNIATGKAASIVGLGNKVFLAGDLS